MPGAAGGVDQGDGPHRRLGAILDGVAQRPAAGPRGRPQLDRCHAGPEGGQAGHRPDGAGGAHLHHTQVSARWAPHRQQGLPWGPTASARGYPDGPSRACGPPAGVQALGPRTTGRHPPPRARSHSVYGSWNAHAWLACSSARPPRASGVPARRRRRQRGGARLDHCGHRGRRVRHHQRGGRPKYAGHRRGGPSPALQSPNHPTRPLCAPLAPTGAGVSWQNATGLHNVAPFPGFPASKLVA